MKLFEKGIAGVLSGCNSTVEEYAFTVPVILDLRVSKRILRMRVTMTVKSVTKSKLGIIKINTACNDDYSVAVCSDKIRSILLFRFIR